MMGDDKYVLWIQHKEIILTQEQLDNLYNLIKRHASFTNQSELK
jgi:hypothetical protein